MKHLFAIAVGLTIMGIAAGAHAQSCLEQGFPPSVCNSPALQWSRGLNSMTGQSNNDRRITAQQACQRGNPNACAQMRADTREMPNEIRRNEDMAQFQGALNQQDKIYQGIEDTDQEIQRQNDLSFAAQQRDGYTAEADAARQSGNYRAFHAYQQKALYWDQQVQNMR